MPAIRDRFYRYRFASATNPTIIYKSSRKSQKRRKSVINTCRIIAEWNFAD
jgi:hypothetical protein